MKKMMKDMLNKMKDQKGATAVEYGIMVALIAAVIIAVVTTVGTEVQGAFQTVADGLGSSGTGTP